MGAYFIEYTGKSFMEARITINFFFQKQLSHEFFKVRLFMILVKLGF